MQFKRKKTATRPWVERDFQLHSKVMIFKGEWYIGFRLGSVKYRVLGMSTNKFSEEQFIFSTFWPIAVNTLQK